jgi:hypothetical protein
VVRPSSGVLVSIALILKFWEEVDFDMFELCKRFLVAP